jgi:hypothetical protein
MGVGGSHLSLSIRFVELVAFPLGSNFGAQFPSISCSVRFNNFSAKLGSRHFEIKTTKTRPKIKFANEIFTSEMS